jgi:hypothetical protein
MRRVLVYLATLAVAATVVPATLASTSIYFDPTVGVPFQQAQESAFLAAASGVTTITFDEFAPNAILTGNEYAGLGIVFSQPGGQLLRALGANANFTPVSQTNSLFPYNQSSPGDERLQLDLATPRYAVGLWLIDPEFPTPGVEDNIQFYNASHALLLSIPQPHLGYVSGDANGNFFIGVISSDPIAQVLLNEYPGDLPYEEDVGWDNVYFGAPEPASLSLLGVLGLAMLRRR